MDGHSLLSWRYTFIPIYAIGNGLSIFIPLYIFANGGSVVDVGIAFSIYYAVSIPASLLFGRMTDRLDRTKPFILLSAVFTLPVLAAFLLPGSVEAAWVYYALYAIAATASTPALNVLVMGHSTGRKKMPKYYSKFGVFSILGFVLAMVVGLLIPGSDLPLYLASLLAFGMAAIVLSAVLIKDQPVGKAAKENVASRRALSVVNATIHKGFLEYGLVQRVRSMVHSKRKRSLYKLLFAIVLFNLGYYVFYSSYVPFQLSFGLSYTDIFMIQLLNGLAQVGAFLILLEMVKRPMLHRYFVASSGLRGAAYIAMAVSVFMPVAVMYTLNAFAYMLGGAVIAFWNLSSTVLLYHRIKGRDEGYYLGLWSGLYSFAAIAGSFASGLLSYYIGYAATFTIAAMLTAASGIAFAVELKEH